MKIAISSTGPSIDDPLDERFGRCPCFVIADVDGAVSDPLINTHASMGSGAGIQTARTLVKWGVSVVLTGHCGPNAVDALAEAGVWVVTGCSGTVRDAYERFLAELIGSPETKSEPSARTERTSRTTIRSSDGEYHGGKRGCRRRGRSAETEIEGSGYRSGTRLG